MEFTKIRVDGPTNVDFPIQGADPAGPFILKGVEGLGPPEIDVLISNTLYLGGIYQGRRPQNREIIMRIGLQPDYAGAQTAEQLRTILYGLLTPRYGKLLTYNIVNDEQVVALTEGQAKRFEVALFSKDPEVQITIACPQPYLKAPSFSLQTPPIRVASGVSYFDINNVGTAPSGFWMGFILNNGHNGTLQIGDAAAGGQLISVNRTWAIGDRVTINTQPGARGIWRTPAGSNVLTSILDDMEPYSDWLELAGGVNTLMVNNSNIKWYLGLSHTPVYWGV